MAKLYGAQQIVLQAISALSVDSVTPVTDSQVTANTDIALADVRNWIQTLEEEGYVDSYSTTGGIRASINSKGRLVLQSVVPVVGSQHDTGETFWAPFARKDSTIILGRFYERLRTFEASGLVAFGDSMACAELRGGLEVLGAKKVTVTWATQIKGKSLPDNLIMLGGPDVNEISRRFLQKVNPRLRSGLDKADDITLYDTLKGNRYTPSMSANEEETSIDYGVIISTKNPFSNGKQAVCIAGCFGYGTWAGARFVLSEEFLSHPLVKSREPFECMIKTEVFYDAPQTIELIEIRKLDMYRSPPPPEEPTLPR